MANIRKRNGKWQVQIRRKNALSLTKSFATKTDAKQWANDMNAKADRHELPNTGKEFLNWTVGQLLERYESEISSKKSCYPSERYCLGMLRRAKFASKTLKVVSAADFVEYRNNRLKIVKPATFNREIAIIRHAFNIAKKEWNFPIAQNPALDIKKPKVINGRNRRLESHELKNLAMASSKTRNPYLWDIVLFAIETGMRKSEILALRVEHIDFEKNILLIPKTKTGFSRTIPLSKKAVEILRDKSPVNGVRFETSSIAVRLAWDKLTRRANIVDLHFHDLRHEAVSRFFEKGLTVPEVALISGHRDLRMLMRYTHVKAENIAVKLC